MNSSSEKTSYIDLAVIMRNYNEIIELIERLVVGELADSQTVSHVSSFLISKIKAAFPDFEPKFKVILEGEKMFILMEDIDTVIALLGINPSHPLIHKVNKKEVEISKAKLTLNENGDFLVISTVT